MAFGKSKQSQSYGVPVRAAVPPPIAPPMGGPVPVGAPYPTQQPLQYQAQYPAQYPSPQQPPQYAAQYPSQQPAPQYAPQYARQQPPVQYTPQPPAPYAAPPWAGGPTAYGPPTPPNPAYTGGGTKRTRTPFKIAGGVILAIIVISGVVSNFKEQSALKPPQTLAGRSLTTDPAMLATVKKTTAKTRDRNQGRGAAVAIYEDVDGRPEFMMYGLRAVTREDREVTDAIANGIMIDRASVVYYGAISCYAAGNLSVCMWHGDISGGVIAFHSQDLAATAAITAEAKAALH